MKQKKVLKLCLTSIFVISLVAMTMVTLASALPVSATAAANLVSPTKTSAVPNTCTLVVASTASDPITLPAEIPAEVLKLRDQLPATIDDAEAKTVPVLGRFVMYTYDLRHILWGQFGNHYFTGVDNMGVRVWGIYGQGYFAGLYNGQFFWGKYSCSLWSARNLFKLNYACGRYVTTPLPAATSNSIQP